jgi:acetyl-CoA synthetase
MTLLTDLTLRHDTLSYYSPEKLWELFDGSRERLNIGHECVDRHSGSGRTAIRIAYADGHEESIGFAELSSNSSRFAHRLAEAGVSIGDRVAIMLDPSPEFYAILFGALKAGAAVVPMFTLFGPDAINARLEDSKARILVTNADKARMLEGTEGLDIWAVDQGLSNQLSKYPEAFEPRTSSTDVAFYQYTSGTTRQMPAAVKMTHRSIVTTMLPGLYGVGLRPGDEYFCPSSPAWGHGLWQGTLAPMAVGITTGTYSGKFDPERLATALANYGITNLSAAATHYRMLRTSGALARHSIPIKKLSFAGEPIDGETEAFLNRQFGVRVCSIFGSTEVGAILVHYPEAADVPDKPGSLGLPVPGIQVEVQKPDGSPAAIGEIGEIKVWRNGNWLPTRDLGRVDEDGFFYHHGRADDVIISAGWTLSAVEIENSLMRHADVREVAAIGVADEVRGQVVKAFVVSDRDGSEAFAEELRNLARATLGQHEYPRLVAFVAELPKTPAGKINRKALRDRETTNAVAA